MDSALSSLETIHSATSSLSLFPQPLQCSSFPHCVLPAGHLLCVREVCSCQTQSLTTGTGPICFQPDKQTCVHVFIKKTKTLISDFCVHGCADPGVEVTVLWLASLSFPMLCGLQSPCPAVSIPTVSFSHGVRSSAPSSAYPRCCLLQALPEVRLS